MPKEKALVELTVSVVGAEENKVVVVVSGTVCSVVDRGGRAVGKVGVSVDV